MRPIVSDWQGRETELKIVKDWLDNDEIQLAFITGIGGMGKTSLAVTVFNQSEGFQDKFWADLVIPYKFPSLARRILQQFWKLSSLDEVDQELKNRGFSDSTLRNALIKTLQDQRFLLVLDNFESVVEDSEYLEFLLEWLDNCYKTEIIVTTQDMPPQIQSRLKDISVLPLQGLLTQAGVDFLRREINEPESELKILVEMVYGHPLTLKMLAAYLKDGMKIEDFKTELKQLDIASLMEHPEIKGRHRREEVQLEDV